jgi:hypothetical protein
MIRSARSTRVLAVSACGALVSALALLPSGGASAALPKPALILMGSVSFSNSLPTCTEVGTPPNDSIDFAHGSASDSVSMDTTVTNSGDAGDHTHVTGNLSATGKLKRHNGSMTSFRLSGTGKVTAVRAEGSASQCAVSANMTAETTVPFTEAKSGWVYAIRSQGKKVLSEMVIEGPKGVVYLDLFGGSKSTNTERVFLKPGQYESISAFIINSGPFIALKAPATTTLSGAFHAAGSALGGTRGPARAFVQFPKSISCSHHSARLTWTGKAGQVADGSFFVNGKRRASVSSAKPGHSVVLRHLSRTGDNVVKANLSLKGGGHASATRTYVACKG